jgi:general stress protein 26
MITIENFKCYSLFWRTNNQEIKGILTAGALMIHLGTVDEKGHANIHPAWYYYDSSTDKLYIQTGKQSKKTYNVRNNEIIYFCIDDKNLHTKGCVKKQAWRYMKT